MVAGPFLDWQRGRFYQPSTCSPPWSDRLIRSIGSIGDELPKLGLQLGQPGSLALDDRLRCLCHECLVGEERADAFDIPFQLDDLRPATLGNRLRGVRVDAKPCGAQRAGRHERRAVAVDGPGPHVVPYLNRLSSLLWTAARWVEADDALLSRTALEDA